MGHHVSDKRTIWAKGHSWGFREALIRRGPWGSSGGVQGWTESKEKEFQNSRSQAVESGLRRVRNGNSQGSWHREVEGDTSS